jgi:metal-responsive CopG/Arc/MetJ family transcriptional regulator
LVKNEESVIISISIPKDLLEKIDKATEFERTDRSSLIRKLILKYLASKNLLSPEEQKYWSSEE